MKSLFRVVASLALPAAALLSLSAPDHASAQSQRGIDARSQRAIEHWTADRRAAAVPRDLVIDERGQGYLAAGGRLIPYGQSIAQPAAGSDAVGPAVTNMSPANGATVGAAASLSATVTDASGVRSVTFYVRQGANGRAQSFTGSAGPNNTWSVNLSGFTNGAWSWWLVAKDGAKPANSTTSPTVNFTVDTSSGGGGGGGGGEGTVTNSEYTGGGVIQRAAGRIYFEMPDNARRTRWAGYVCSGTVTNDGTTGRSIVITAAHCVYDDANKAFARNVLFIPDQANTTGTGTDLNCANDPIGCWAPDFGVVDVNWTTRTFPDNVAWDYAYYVINDSGAYSAGRSTVSSTLDAAVTPMSVSFSAPSLGTLAHGLGYSYSDDPNFMFCADPLEALDAVNFWLPNCGLSGGSSGGPWVQPFTNGNGPIISVNSWGYTTAPGMAGPKLVGTTASCLFSRAKSGTLGLTYADGDAGVVVSSCP